MATINLTFIIKERGKVSILIKFENQPQFEINLRGQLRIIGWWRILTGEKLKSKKKDYDIKNEFKKELKHQNLI